MPLGIVKVDDKDARLLFRTFYIGRRTLKAMETLHADPTNGLPPLLDADELRDMWARWEAVLRAAGFTSEKPPESPLSEPAPGTRRLTCPRCVRRGYLRDDCDTCAGTGRAP